MHKITLQMYKRAMELRVPLLQRSRVLVQENGEFSWEDAPPWQLNPEDVDDGYGAYHGRGVLRPVGTAKMPPAQGSMPGRTATAALLKEKNRRDREVDPETGKTVSNRLPSERSHHNRYSSRSVRSTTTLPDGRRVVLGRTGRILKTLTARLNRVRKPRESRWRVVLVTEG